MGAPLALSEAEFNDVLQRIESSLQNAVDLSNKIVDTCNSFGRWLGPLWDDVVAMLNKFVGLVEKLISEIGKFFTEPGVPWALWNHGTQWTEQVGRRASGIQAQATTGQTEIDERWQGPAATAYLGTLPDQNKALASMIRR
jgi:hypothetical protein